MKFRFLVPLVFTCISFCVFSQVATPPEALINRKTVYHKYSNDTIAYPLKGVCQITYTGNQLFKDFELWVYDAKGNEIYYSVQTMPVNEKYNELILQVMDREYKEWMMRNGAALTQRLKRK